MEGESLSKSVPKVCSKQLGIYCVAKEISRHIKLVRNVAGDFRHHPST